MKLTIHGLDKEPLHLYHTVAVPEVGETLVHEIPDGTSDLYRIVRRDWSVRHQLGFSALRTSEILLDVAIWVEEVTP